MLDGTRRKGYVYDLSMERGDFHLYFSQDMSDADAEVILLKECKAVYFVKSLTGNPDYQENKTDLRGKTGFGRPFEVLFADGELLRGVVETYDPDKLGFYILPPDPKSNNERIYVVRANAKKVALLPAFGADVEGARWETPDPVRYPPERRVEFVMRILRGKDVEALSEECYLPAAVLMHWRGQFLGGGVAALRREDPAPGAGAPAGPRRRALKFPAKKRVEAVLRVILQEDEAVVSQVFLAPLHVMAEWRDRFLEAGKAHLAAEAERERGESPEALRERYEAIVGGFAPASETVPALLERFLSAGGGADGAPVKAARPW
jgi:hypothetical protein